MLENIQQPSIPSLLQRMSQELSAKAVVLLHSNGQILYRSGWMEENEFPIMATLVAAMTSAGKMLGNLGDNEQTDPTRFSCESDWIGLYAVNVSSDYWLATLYDQPLNPGLFRMKVRRYAETIAKLGVTLPEQWEEESGVTLPPPGNDNSALFENITDEEIDGLFEEARS